MNRVKHNTAIFVQIKRLKTVLSCIPQITSGMLHRRKTQTPATYRNLQTFPPACGWAFPDRFCWHRYSSRSPASVSPSHLHQEKSVNTFSQLWQDDFTTTRKSCHIALVINQFHKHFSFPLYWLDIQYLYCVFIQYQEWRQPWVFHRQQKTILNAR